MKGSVIDDILQSTSVSFSKKQTFCNAGFAYSGCMQPEYAEDLHLRAAQEIVPEDAGQQECQNAQTLKTGLI